MLPVALAGPVQAQSLESLVERLERLEQENRELRREIEALKAAPSPPAPAPVTAAAPGPGTDPPAGPGGLAGTGTDFADRMLDPTRDVNRKDRLALEARRNGTLASNAFRFHGDITAVANWQSSNRADSFGYLMRHPTAKNQIGKEVSEAAVHSARLAMTATAGDRVIGHAEALFDPGQSFGSGTNTSLERNQLQMRKAWLLFGDLDRSPFHASIGKMAVPFGLTDTFNPFSASSAWHAFGGIANGVKLGYASDRLNLALMGIQGGAQFRAANMPVKGTGVPSRLNNLAFDANRQFGLGRDASLLLGGSYQRGTAYCQDYPVVHFEPCRAGNPGVGVYGRLDRGPLAFKAELARTTEVWPGTFNPGIPQFPASKVTALDLGAKYRLERGGGPLDLSVEFGRLKTGPDGAPWERQDQLVLAAAWSARPGLRLFAEYVRTAGFVPLNFISGGSVMDGGEVDNTRTISDRDARSDVLLFGARVAF